MSESIGNIGFQDRINEVIREKARNITNRSSHINIIIPWENCLLLAKVALFTAGIPGCIIWDSMQESFEAHKLMVDMDKQRRFQYLTQ